MYRIVKKQVLNPTVTRMDIEAPLIAKKAEPGQFIILRVDEAGGVRFVCNDGKTAALGVTVRCGDRAVLRYGALLPLERVEVAKQGPIVVQYGNPI